jgi:hypothetical protein
MRTVADPGVVHSLKQRLDRLRPDARRRWGTLTPHEMLCHLGDAFEMVLRTRPRRAPITSRSKPIVKAIGLWSPLRWPRGVRTNPMHDPRAEGTRPSDFAKDLARTVAALEAIGAAATSNLEPAHGIFGTMSNPDWQRWAYKHVDHHLRQFGL